MKQREQDSKIFVPFANHIPSAGIIRVEVLRVYSQLFLKLKHPDMILR